MIELNDEESICLFRLMKRQETELEECLVPLLTRIERLLYKTMSIEEVERLSMDQNSRNSE